mmetsp:Transcript_4844/g.10274  ORF Transcript_4844/g.10274 Transcript_4844/m.10274 type:complete len:212 (-) Transcript_4844:65-700(-)
MRSVSHSSGPNSTGASSFCSAVSASHTLADEEEEASFSDMIKVYPVHMHSGRNVDARTTTSIDPDEIRVHCPLFGRATSPMEASPSCIFGSTSLWTVSLTFFILVAATVKTRVEQPPAAAFIISTSFTPSMGKTNGSRRLNKADPPCPGEVIIYASIASSSPPSHVKGATVIRSTARPLGVKRHASTTLPRLLLLPPLLGPNELLSFPSKN